MLSWSNLDSIIYIKGIICILRIIDIMSIINRISTISIINIIDIISIKSTQCGTVDVAQYKYKKSHVGHMITVFPLKLLLPVIIKLT